MYSSANLWSGRGVKQAVLIRTSETVPRDILTVLESRMRIRKSASERGAWFT